ncbi:toll-like receptor 13 [Protopterus annectens]|uniref:toll-like receptor 13 n=1 Tax=Protopterus annectens TaxID=7888 RepID=UPI001CFAF46D|nr:toll-like receptor 13 [Protopterus annectens]
MHILLQSFARGWISRKCFLYDAVSSQYTYYKFPCGRTFPENFTFALCDTVVSYETEFKEIICQLDGLCSFFENIEPDTFIQFSNLKILSLFGAFDHGVVYSGAFQNLENLLELLLSFHDSLASHFTIQKGAFQGLSKLRVLEIKNYNFSAEGYYPFKELSTSLESLSLKNSVVIDMCDILQSIQHIAALKHLNLDDNKIHTLHNCCQAHPCGTTNDLLNLSTLSLRENPLHKIEVGSLYYIKDIRVIDLSGTELTVQDLLMSGIHKIENISFSGMSHIGKDLIERLCQTAYHLQVKNLILTQNDILDLSSKALSKCQAVETLDVSYNFMKYTEAGILASLKMLKQFILSVNKLTTINFCPLNQTITVSITHLDLSYNSVLVLKSNGLVCMDTLQYLSLENNKISIIENLAFSGLRRLSELNLKENRISVLEQHYFTELKDLYSVNLLGNNIHEMSEGVFKDQASLQELHLGNIMKQLSLDISELQSLQTLHLQANDEITILSSKPRHISSLQIFKMHGPRFILEIPLPALKQLHVKGNDDLFTSSESICFFIHLETLYFQSSGTRKASLTLSKLYNLKHLYLKDLYYTTEYNLAGFELVFQNLTKLETLVLVGSGFPYFTFRMFKDLTSLKSLIIEDQRIETLAFEVFRNCINLKFLLFNNIIFQCTCKNAWIVLWAAAKRDMILNVQDEVCAMEYQKSKFVSFLDKTCDISVQFAFFLGSTIFVLLFIIFTFLSKKLGWHIVYFVYIIRARLAKLKGQKPGRIKYKHDVFVSYSSKDEFWVIHELIPNLEQKGPPFLKVCLHNRDFEVGKDIVDNIVDSIYNSRKIICVITHHYLRSEWCSLEMRMATYKVLAESQDFLILVFLERISPYEISAYHRLAKMIKKKTYVEWPEVKKEQLLFWERLKNSI